MKVALPRLAVDGPTATGLLEEEDGRWSREGARLVFPWLSV